MEAAVAGSSEIAASAAVAGRSVAGRRGLLALAQADASAVAPVAAVAKAVAALDADWVAFAALAGSSGRASAFVTAAFCWSKLLGF